MPVSVRSRGRERFHDHLRHFAFDALRRDDDRVREAFRAAPVLAEHLVGLLAACPLHGHLLELLLQLRDRQPAALETVARLDDLLDVELEDVAPVLLAVGPLAPSQERAQAPAAFAQRQGDLLADLVVLGDRLLRFARERDPDRGHVDEDHHGPGRQRAPGLRHAVGPPRRCEHRREDRAGRLLVDKRHAVRVADDARELVVVTLIGFALRERDRLLLLVLLRLLGPSPVGQARLDHEGIAAVHRWRPADRRVEVALDLLVEPRENRPLADRREAVGRRRHDLRRLDRLVEILRGLAVDVPRTRARREARGLADVLGQTRRHTTEIAGQESREPVALRVLEHLEQHPELDAVGMRLDLARRLRNPVVRPGKLLGFSLGREVRELDVRVRDDRLLDVLVDRSAALLVAALDFHRHLGAARRLPVDLLLLQNQRLVLLGVYLASAVLGGRSPARPRDDLNRLAGRELTVHPGRRDADALLAAAHAQPVEFRSVQELREDRRDLLSDDTGAVVGHGDAKAARLARGRRRATVADRLDLDDDVREDSGLFAGLERVVDGLLDAGQQGFSRIVEAEELAILCEELRDGDLPLARSHLDGGDRRSGGRDGSGRTGLRMSLLAATRCQWLARWFA